jgi:peptidoglycan/LPS O-acetylase OafA/YrhL
VGCLLAILSAFGPSRHLLEQLARKTYFPVVTLVILFVFVCGGDWLDRAAPRPAAYRDTVGFAIEPVIIAVFLIQVVLLAARGPWRWLEWPPLRLIGRLSYSLYLYQQLALWTVASRLADRPRLLQLVAAVAVTAVLAAASYYLVERPFLQIRNGVGFSLLRPRLRAARSRSRAGGGKVSLPPGREAPV